jgi:hypothetical protein
LYKPESRAIILQYVLQLLELELGTRLAQFVIQIGCKSLLVADPYYSGGDWTLAALATPVGENGELHILHDYLVDYVEVFQFGLPNSAALAYTA